MDLMTTVRLNPSGCKNRVSVFLYLGGGVFRVLAEETLLTTGVTSIKLNEIIDNISQNMFLGCITSVDSSNWRDINMRLRDGGQVETANPLP